MTRQNFALSSLLVACCLLVTACAPAATPVSVVQTVEVPLAQEVVTTVEVAATCPPIQNQVSASLPGEITKITILAGAIAFKDPGNKGWCDTSQLKLGKTSLSGLVSTNGCFIDRNDNTYPCSVYNPLAALDIQPRRIKFPLSPRPVLVFDLSKTENKPYCTEIGGDCGGFAIYQLNDPVLSEPWLAWRYVSPATLIAGSTPAAVEGHIDRFSTIALVELPPPQPFPAVITSVMIVASEFIPDEPDNENVFLVTFLIRDDTLGMTDQTRLFRFSDPEMQLTVNGAYPAECLDTKIYTTVPEQLTCLFPSDMEVILVNGVDNIANQISITPASGEYEARLFANLEVH